MNDARLISTNLFRDTGLFRYLPGNKIKKGEMPMNKNKKTIIAIITGVVLALMGAAAVSAINGGGQSDSKANQSGVNDSGKQSSGSDQSNPGPDKSTSDSNSDSKASNSSSTSVTVNGQKVAVPQNGSYDYSQGGVRVSGNNSQSSSTSSGGSASNNSSTSVNIQSQ